MTARRIGIGLLAFVLVFPAWAAVLWLSRKLLLGVLPEAAAIFTSFAVAGFSTLPLIRWLRRWLERRLPGAPPQKDSL